MKKSNIPFIGSHIIWGIVSVLFAAFLYVGGSIEYTGKIIGLSTIRIAPFIILSLAFLIFAGITCIRCASRNSRLQPVTHMERWVFWLLLSDYLLYIFMLYPGSLAYDSRSQLLQFLTGYLANDNPVAVTVLYGVLFEIGRTISNSNFGVFLCCFVQALLMAYAFSKVFSFVKQSVSSKRVAFCVFAFFFVVPIWGGAAQTLLKDSLHVSIFVLFFLQFIKMFDEHVSRKDMLLFILWMFASAVSRKASGYIVLACCFMLVLYHTRKHRRSFIVLTVAFWLVFSLYENVLIPGLGIREPQERENYSLQFQQVAQICIDHGDELSAEDIAIINSVLDFEAMKEVYDPSISDPVKVLYHDDGSLQEFNKLYQRLLLRYPLTCLEATVLGKWEYFYPPSEGRQYFRSYIPTNNLKIYRTSGEINTPILEWADLWVEQPILKLFIGPGLYTWLTIVAFAAALSKKNKKSILIVLPMVLFTLGMLVTPTNGENRYAYPIMALVPVLLTCVCIPTEQVAADNP